jgi:hypothetical protein
MAAEPAMVRFFLMGKPHDVPKGLTIQKAMEYAGFRLLRGCGCRGGFCGACGTVYRIGSDYRLKVGLACQTVVQDQMYLAQIPFYPAVKAQYRVEDLPPTAETMISLYPEILRCVGCNTCRKVCPQELEVMRYIAGAAGGHPEAGRHVLDCLVRPVASRCPAEIAYNGPSAGGSFAPHHSRPRIWLQAAIDRTGATWMMTATDPAACPI